MLNAPTVPTLNTPQLGGIFTGFPARLDLSPMGLGIVLALVVIFFATMSVILLYHWRRFPYDQSLFDRVEAMYIIVSAILLAVSILGILVS